MRIDVDARTASSSCGEGKTVFTSDQRAALEAKFLRKKYPTRQEKVKLASKLGVDICKVQVSLKQTKNTLHMNVVPRSTMDRNGGTEN